MSCITAIRKLWPSCRRIWGHDFYNKDDFCLFRVPHRLSKSFEKSPGFPGIILGLPGLFLFAFLFSETRIIPGENGHEFV